MSPPSLRSSMGRDRSLEEFLGGESDESASDADAEADDDPTESEAAAAAGEPTDPDTNATDAGHTATVPDGVEPAAVTYRWDPGGIECTECGATVDRLWSGDSGPVCADCKVW